MTGKRGVIGFVLALAIGFLTATGTASAQPQMKKVAPRPAAEPEYRLMITVDYVPGGMLVRTVDPNGPGAQMSRSVNGQAFRGILEPGDMIVSVDGVAIRTQDDYVAAMRASNAGRVRLGVKDRNTGQVTNWYVQAVPVGPQVNPNPNPNPNPNGPVIAGRATAVTVLIVADTDDLSIGQFIQKSRTRLETELADIDLPAGRVRVKTLSGNRVSAQGIMAEVNALRVGPTETVVYYHLGHGAFDASRAGWDPTSGGHFFQLPRGDLMRKTVWDTLKAKGAQLTVMVTDTCNIPAPARPMAPAPSIVNEQQYMMKRSAVGDLLLCHAGEVNVSGSSTNQYGWYSPDLGGWFSDAFCSGLSANYTGNGPVTWDAFLGVVGRKTSETYRSNRTSILKMPGLDQETRNLMLNQIDQTPQAFVRSVRTVR